MKLNLKIFLALAGAALLTAGCVETVSGSKTAGVPFIKDKIEARYPRPLDQVFEASKAVIQENGILNTESILQNQTNAAGPVKIVEGKVNQRNVWVRVEQVEPAITDVIVQTRTSSGVSDIDLAARID